jgi:indole-3-glycerol phosphate synthase
MTKTDTPDILQKIVDYKRGELAAARAATPLAELKVLLGELEDRPRGFGRALEDAHMSGWTPIIAEVKKGSPSKGIIRADFNPLDIAEIYQQNGATCLSVLTDEHFFLGHLSFLALIREQVGLPLLRKDFIYDPYQVYEARVAGADAILLIAAMLDTAAIEDLAGLSRELSMDVLLEVHDQAELEAALRTDCRLIGINNRDLRTFVTDLAATERMAPQVTGGGRIVVAESGIEVRADIVRLQKAGAQAFLIGESLMREADIGAKLRELTGSEL